MMSNVSKIWERLLPGSPNKILIRLATCDERRFNPIVVLEFTTD